MTLRKRVLSATAIMVALLVLMVGCDVTFFIWSPDSEPDPVEPGIHFTLSWDESDVNTPHLYVTYPAPDDNNTVDDLGVPTFVEPFLPISSGGDTGFVPFDHLTGALPNETVDDRGVVYFGDTQSAYSIGVEPAIEFVDSSDSSETILLRGFPFDLPGTHVESTSGGALTGLPAGPSYMWVGVIEVYAYATNGQIVYEDGRTVDAVFTATQNDEELFRYEFPLNTDVIGSALLRIDCFFLADGTEFYLINQDARQIQGTGQIRSVASASEPMLVQIPRN